MGISNVLHIPLPDDVAKRLEARASEEGVDVVTLASRSLKRESKRPSLCEVLKPVHEAFARSGMTDDELADFLEAEKYEMRGVSNERN